MLLLAQVSEARPAELWQLREQAAVINKLLRKVGKVYSEGRQTPVYMLTSQQHCILQTLNLRC